MVRVTAERPCPACKHTTWCLIAKDGSAGICQREETRKKCGDAGWLHVYSEVDREQSRPVHRPSQEPPKKAIDWRMLAKKFSAMLTEESKARYTSSLGLPANAYERFPYFGVCYEGDEEVLTFAETTGKGDIIGLNRRYPSGEKKFMPGGSRGLTLPKGWFNPGDGPIYVVEGASDTMAMISAGLFAIGRPSNQGGAAFIAEYLQTINQPKVPVVIVGENDRRWKPDKGVFEWPGLVGAVRVAGEVAKQSKNEVFWTLPPQDYKDARDYLTCDYFERDGGTSWVLRGLDLNEELLSKSTAAAILPEGYKEYLDLLDKEIGFNDDRWKY